MKWEISRKCLPVEVKSNQSRSNHPCCFSNTFFWMCLLTPGFCSVSLYPTYAREDSTNSVASFNHCFNNAPDIRYRVLKKA
jgi:hypothetical protein